MKEETYLLALNFTPGIGAVLTRNLISYCGSAEAVFKTPKQKLRKIPGIGDKLLKVTENIQSYLNTAEEEMEKAQNAGAAIHTFISSGYPKKLKGINDAPAALYFKGKCNLNNPKCIAIVGTRNATTYGKKVVEEIIEGVKKYNPIIVSGLAYGIDIHAHKHALKNNLDTIGVMASGIDIIYPKVHTKIANQMMGQGGIVTEFPIGTIPDAPNFPKRNRIIAGMADAVIVVEAAERGGALITAELANGYNRDVLAVPGNLNSSYSEGCNKLIRNHKANILTNPDDIAYILDWPEAEGKDEIIKDVSELNSKEQKIISLLSQQPEGLMIDSLSHTTEIPVGEIASVLLNLEIGGWIISLPGKKYQLN